jgi:hypothetical protein
MTQDPVKNLFALTMLVSWQSAGYMMLIYITGLNNIPEDLIIAVRDVKTGDYVGIYRPNKKDGRYLLVMLPDNNYEIAYEASGHLIHSVEHTPTKDDVKETAKANRMTEEQAKAALRKRGFTIEGE